MTLNHTTEVNDSLQRRQAEIDRLEALKKQKHERRQQYATTELLPAFITTFERQLNKMVVELATTTKDKLSAKLPISHDLVSLISTLWFHGMRPKDRGVFVTKIDELTDQIHHRHPMIVIYYTFYSRSTCCWGAPNCYLNIEMKLRKNTLPMIAFTEPC
jgi:hypothetical protein